MAIFKESTRSNQTHRSEMAKHARTIVARPASEGGGAPKAGAPTLQCFMPGLGRGTRVAEPKTIQAETVESSPALLSQERPFNDPARKHISMVRPALESQASAVNDDDTRPLMKKQLSVGSVEKPGLVIDPKQTKRY